MADEEQAPKNKGISLRRGKIAAASEQPQAVDIPESEAPVAPEATAAEEAPPAAAPAAAGNTLPGVVKRSSQMLEPEKLSVMPLAVLLPSIGDLKKLSPMVEELFERQQEAQAARASADSETERALAVEESMLNQVLQWLTLGGQG